MNKNALLQKYLAGLTSPEEEKKLYRLLQAEENNDAYQDISLQLWNGLQKRELNPERRDRMYRHIAQHTSQTQVRYPYLKWAAAIALLITCAGLLFYYTGGNTLQYETSLAERKSVNLPDGSLVQLNESSKIRFSDDWQENGLREVWLEGEAYFRVSKVSSERGTPVKFVVHAQDLDIQVLGTAFNVQSTPEEVQVVLSEGSVRLANPTAQIEMDMEPGQLVAYSVQNQQTELRRVKTKHFSAWKEGRYVFEGLTLSEISEVLLHNYDKVVSIKGEALQQRRISATIPSTDLQVVLAVIKEAMKVEIVQQGDTIIIK